MSSLETIDILNRVLAILRRSFPQYLRYAHPYLPRGDSRAMKVIDGIVASQDALAERVSGQIVSVGARPNSGQFPTEFTDAHDLGIDYLIQEAIGYQRQDIAELEECLDSLSLAPVAHSLTAEAIGLAKRHLELLEGLGPKPGASTIVRDGPPRYDND
jgi:hypothetical protein